MGDDADDVLTTTRITAGDRAKYSKVIEKLDSYYKEGIVFRVMT